MERVSAREAHELMRREGYLYLDVRSVPEFEQGHPEGAYNVPIAHPGDAAPVPNRAFVREVVRLFPLHTPLVVGCASGVRSRQAAELLAAAGFSRVVEQRAGMLGVRDPFGRLKERGWRDEELPVAVTAVAGRSYRELAEPPDDGKA